MVDLEAIEPYKSHSREMQEAANLCVRITDAYKNIFTVPSELCFNIEEVEEGFRSLPSEDRFEPKSDFEDIGYLPTNFENAPVSSIQWLHGIADSFKNEMECYISYTSLPDSGMVALNAERKQSQGCRAINYSITLNADGAVEIDCQYYTHRGMYRLKPVSNTMRLFHYGTTEETRSFDDWMYEDVRFAAHAATLFDPYARVLADNTLAAYRPILVTLLTEAGLTHTEIGRILQSSRSTVSSQAQEFREVREDLREHREKIERTEQLVTDCDVTTKLSIARMTD